MAKPQILQLGIIDHAHEEWAALGEIGDIIEPKAKNREEFIDELKRGVFDNVLVVYRTFQSVSTTGLFNSELVSLLPKGLRFICHYGAGYDQVDVQACTARHIRVSNVPIVGDDATADVAMFLILGALRGFSYPTLSLRRGTFKGNPQPPLGHDPRGKVLGILGMGGIGCNMMEKAKAFGMIPIYHNRNKLSPELSAGANWVSFEDLLAKSDVISLNLPLTPSTRHLISTSELAAMKPGVTIINTARGAVLDTGALISALASGHVRSVGLDVYEDEPHVPQELLDNEHVYLMPHMGTYTVETQRRMELCNMDNVRSAILHGKLLNLVVEQRDEKFQSYRSGGT